MKALITFALFPGLVILPLLLRAVVPDLYRQLDPLAGILVVVALDVALLGLVAGGAMLAARFVFRLRNRRPQKDESPQPVFRQKETTLMPA